MIVEDNTSESRNFLEILISNPFDPDADNSPEDILQIITNIEDSLSCFSDEESRKYEKRLVDSGYGDFVPSC